MTPSEKRISTLEDMLASELEDGGWLNKRSALDYLIVRALCEIARQMARIADTLQFGTLQFELIRDDETIRRFAAGPQEKKP